MAKILLANHWGGGTGHARRFRAIASALKAHGHQPLLALPDLVAAEPVLADVDYPVLQGPFWRGRAVKRKLTRNFTDILASHGLAEPRVFLPMARGWNTLLETLKPDLVVADYAPVLQIVARGRRPCVALGAPFCVPQAQGEDFPDLNPDAPPAFEAGKILELVNPWLQNRGVETLDNLPQLYPAQTSFAFGLPELDPYRDVGRLHPVRPLPRTCAEALGAAPATSDVGVFAYLSARHKPSMRLLVRLARSGIAVRCFLRDGNREVAGKLRSVDVEVCDQPVPIAEALASAHAYLHHGSGTAADDGLLLGRPQLCMPVDLEKRLISEVLVNMGVGLNLRASDEVEQLPQQVRDFCLADASHERAQTVAREFNGRFTEDPMPDLIAAFERIMA